VIINVDEEMKEGVIVFSRRCEEMRGRFFVKKILISSCSLPPGRGETWVNFPLS
jgi:hypothetical protein